MNRVLGVPASAFVEDGDHALGELLARIATQRRFSEIDPMNARSVGFVALLLLMVAVGCRKEPFTDCPDEAPLEEYEVEGKRIAIYADGTAHLVKKDRCSFLVQYFDPDFATQYYHHDSSGVWLITDDGTYFPARNRFLEDFEDYADFRDLFVASIQDTQKLWTGFTAQSPDHPEVADYVALRQCIMAGTCDFTDNRMEWVAEPGNPGNHVIRFTAVKPRRNMVTSKMSFESDLPYFVKGMNCWFQADFKIEGEYPYSLMDFENPFFESSPGPRVVISGGALAMENKFGEKLKFNQVNPLPIPKDRWFTLKVHFYFSNEADGMFEMWQDGVLVLGAVARNLPTYHSIQSSLEVGISATNEETVLLLDNVRLSDEPF
jgi:hypothetical protein